MEKKLRAHIFASGRVQGVFFRDGAYRKAERLGILGWICNLPDGKVEAVFEGNEKEVLEMLDWTKHGSVSAKVIDLEVNWEEHKGEFRNFRVK